MIVNFPSQCDIRLVYTLLADFTRFHYPQVPYKRLLTTIEELDEIHGEIQEGEKRWSDLLLVRAYANPTPITQPLSRFGVEEERDVSLVIAVPDLVAAGLLVQDVSTYEITATVGRIGDHFIYHEHEYEVLTFAPAMRWANTDLILYYQVNGKRYAQDATNLLPH